MGSNDIKISIIVAGIRNNNWFNLIQSIGEATQEIFEVIFVGPFNPPEELSNLSNIHYYKDFGSPNRCQQIGVCLASGQFLGWMADDCLFEKNTLQNVINTLNKGQEKSVVVTKYTEGNCIIQSNDYYKMGNAYPKSEYIPHNWWIFNSAFFYRTYFEKLGGWDCQFEGTCLAHADLAVRTQRDEASVIMLDESICQCGHMPTTNGDHAPMHYAQLINDEPLFQRLYQDKECLNRKYVSMDNWKQSPNIWKKRFSNV